MERPRSHLPLLDMQRAYLLGENVRTFDGERATHAVVEYRCSFESAEQLIAALTALFEEHETFRMVVDSPSEATAQRLAPAQVDLSRQIDGRFLDESARLTLVEQERRRLFDIDFDPCSLPRYATSIVWLSDTEALVLLAVDGMLLDGHGISLV